MNRTTITMLAGMMATVTLGSLAVTTASASETTTNNEVIAIEDFYSYYDLNNDGKISISDLAEAKRHLEKTEKLSMNDVNAIRNYIITGEWAEEMSYEEFDIDDLPYNEETKSILDIHNYGLVVGIKTEFDEAGGGSVRIRTLNNMKVTEIRCSTMSLEICYPVVWAYNTEQYHIGISVTDEGALIWDHYGYWVEPDAACSLFPWKMEEILHKAFDFDYDQKITVFDLIKARKEVAIEGTITENDIQSPESYILSGQWNDTRYLETDMDDWEYNYETLDFINFVTSGMFIDHKIAGNELRMRFMNNCEVQELHISRREDVVVPIVYKYNQGNNLVIGVTEEGSLAWDICYEQYPELDDCN